MSYFYQRANQSDLIHYTSSLHRKYKHAMAIMNSRDDYRDPLSQKEKHYLQSTLKSMVSIVKLLKGTGPNADWGPLSNRSRLRVQYTYADLREMVRLVQKKTKSPFISDEDSVFYARLLGDYYRYLCTVARNVFEGFGLDS